MLLVEWKTNNSLNLQLDAIILFMSLLIILSVFFSQLSMREGLSQNTVFSGFDRACFQFQNTLDSWKVE